MKKFVFVILFFLLNNGEVTANQSSNIKVIGNDRISLSTIKDTIGYVEGKQYNLSDINTFQKKLVESGFFEKVKVNFEKGLLIIKLNENPLIDFFYIDGVVNKKREEFFYDNILLGNNKIFSEAKLKKDIALIKETFQDAGYFDVNVDTALSKLPGNVINLVIKVDRKNKYNIKNIFFIGDKKFSSSKLYDVILSSESSWWKFLSSNTLVNINRIDFDRNLLKEFYLNNGYYDVQINSSDINFLSSNTASITFSINAGSKYVFGNHEIKDLEKNLKEEDLKMINKIIKDNVSNENFSKEKISFTQNLINNYLNDKKIEFVQVGVLPTKKNGIIDLEFNFFRTQRKFVNLINITGNSITDENVIRRSLVLSEGDSFAKYKILKSEERLRKTGIFKKVETKIVEKGNELIDIDINVEEQPTGAISAGVGVGSSGSAVSSGIEEKNLFGKGINLKSILSVGTEKVSGTINMKLPDFKNSDNTLDFSLYALTTDYTNSGYESKVVGTNISTLYEVYDDLFFKIGGGIDIDRINTNDTATDLYKSRDGTYNSLKTFYSIDFDKRNSVFFPTSGHLVNFSQAISIPAVSDIPHLKNSLNGSIYKQLSEDYTLNFKGGISTVNSLDNNKDVKLSDRLNLSESNLRGFEPFGIGPMSGSDHIGGNYSAYGSISSTFPNPLPDKWRAKSIMFLDIGNVWGVDFDSNLDSNKLRSSVGISLDWNSPIGPLSFVLSEPISSSSNDIKESFSFKIGSSF